MANLLTGPPATGSTSSPAAIDEAGDRVATGRARGTPAGAPPSPWARAWARLVAWKGLDAALVVSLMAVGLGLRWRTLWTSYWGDEAIAIGIAAHPITSLPHYLVNDGSPPLYYIGLHYWMELFGRSEPATHSLSLIPALLAVPAAWWSGLRLFGPNAARAAAAMVATCAYLDYYSTEARMYSWLVLVAVLAVTTFVLAFRSGGRGYWALATVFMVTVLYLQYYGLYLYATTVAVGLVAAVLQRSWAQARATGLYAAACAAAFAPWVPQFLYQLHHTGAPWAPHPSPLDFFGDSFNALASAGWAGVVAALALAVLGRRRTPAGASGTDRPGRAVAMTAAIPVTTLALAWSAAQVVNSWNPRYLGIAVVPALLPLGGALARSRWGGLGAATAFVALTATAVPMVVDRPVTVLTAKSDAAYLMGQLQPKLRPGALILSSEVTDTPVFALDLGSGYRYATPLGLLQDPMVVNWSNLSTRLHSDIASRTLSELMSSLLPGTQVVLVNPTTWGGGETPEKYASAVEAVAIAADDFVAGDPQLREVQQAGVPAYSEPLYPMEATLFVKV
jgi:mannosyltransferase